MMSHPHALRRLLLLALGAVIPARAAAPHAFTSVRALGDATLARDELVAVPLDETVYRICRPGLPDLRVFDNTGAETPYLTRRRELAQHTPVLNPVETEVLALEPLPDNRIEVRLRPQHDGARVDVMEIVTPLRDFEKRVSVYGRTAPRAGWRTLTDAHPVFDFSRFMDVRNAQIPLPGGAFAEYRVVIADVSDTRESAIVRLSRTLQRGEPTSETVDTIVHRRDFRIDRIRLLHRDWHEGNPVPVLADTKLKRVHIEPDTGDGRTLVRISTDGQPLARLRVRTPAENFSRRAQVQLLHAGPAGDEWRGIARARLERLSFRGVNRERLDIAFPETNADELRLVIENGDAPPLELEGVDGVGPVYRVIFLGAADHTYSMFLGSARATAPEYDTAFLQHLLAEKSGELRTLDPGAARANPEYRGRGFPLLEQRWLLWLAVALILAVLGAAMYRALRRVDTATGADDA